MKMKINLRRGATALTLVALVLVALTATAAAEPKPAIVPKAGDYTGDLKLPTENAPTLGIVEKLGDEYFVGLNPMNPIELTCKGAEPTYLKVYASAEVKGGKFKVTAKIKNPGEIANKLMAVTMRGGFTTPARASGTISARTVVEPGVEGSLACKAGNVKFKLSRG